eukprot:351250-Chlamydomonas_euryale.AAC.4
MAAKVVVVVVAVVDGRLLTAGGMGGKGSIDGLVGAGLGKGNRRWLMKGVGEKGKSDGQWLVKGAAGRKGRNCQWLMEEGGEGDGPVFAILSVGAGRRIKEPATKELCRNCAMREWMASPDARAAHYASVGMCGARPGAPVAAKQGESQKKLEKVQKTRPGPCAPKPFLATRAPDSCGAPAENKSGTNRG